MKRLNRKWSKHLIFRLFNPELEMLFMYSQISSNSDREIDRQTDRLKVYSCAKLLIFRLFKGLFHEHRNLIEYRNRLRTKLEILYLPMFWIFVNFHPEYSIFPTIYLYIHPSIYQTIYSSISTKHISFDNLQDVHKIIMVI